MMTEDTTVSNHNLINYIVIKCSNLAPLYIFVRSIMFVIMVLQKVWKDVANLTESLQAKLLEANGKFSSMQKQLKESLEENSRLQVTISGLKKKQCAKCVRLIDCVTMLKSKLKEKDNTITVMGKNFIKLKFFYVHCTELTSKRRSLQNFIPRHFNYCRTKTMKEKVVYMSISFQAILKEVLRWKMSISSRKKSGDTIKMDGFFIWH